MNSNSNLYYALKEVIIDPASKYMSEIPDINHRFSRKYKRNIALLLGKVEAVNRSLKINFKIAVCIAAAAIGFGASTVIGGDIKKDWTIKTKETIDNRQGAVDFNFIEGDYNGYEEMEDPNEPNMYFPTYIPYGFKLNDEISDPDNDYFYFENGDKTIIYREYPVTATISIDNERFKREKININGYEADLFHYNYDDIGESTIILWCEDYKIIKVSGKLIDKSEVIKVAESVKRQK